MIALASIVAAVNLTLCLTAHQAMELASYKRQGLTTPIAVDRTNAHYGAEVCGRYIGVASPIEQRVGMYDGLTFPLLAWRFEEDGKVGWIADTRLPASADIGRDS